MSVDHFGLLLNVRPLADGRVLVNDGKWRQLVVLDRHLAGRTVILDSAAVGAQHYGRTASPLIPYVGDSTFFVDGGTSTLLLYSPSGALVRVVAPPKATDIPNIAYGASSVDAHGNLIYAVLPQVRVGQFEKGSRDLVVLPSDSSFVLRGSFERRTVDTVGRLSTPAGNRGRIANHAGHIVNTFTYNPLTTRDEWAVFSDGSVGLVRGHDYHVDVLLPNGTWLRGPTLPFDFKRVSDDEKRALIDSARAAHAKHNAIPSAGTILPRPDSATHPQPGSVIEAPTADVLNARNATLVEEYVPLDSMADYWPPIRAGAVKTDLDGHLWILPTTSAQSHHGELVYDVVNTQGEMVYRVRMPIGRSVAGFGHDGVLYLMVKDADGWILERTTLLM